jgi:hypothetical protein
MLIELVVEVLRWLRLAFRSTHSIQAENLFLRRQLALYIERGVKPRRIDSATRIALALLSRLFDWRGALTVVRPKTLIRWHRAGWKLFWRFATSPRKIARRSSHINLGRTTSRIFGDARRRVTELLRTTGASQEIFWQRVFANTNAVGVLEWLQILVTGIPENGRIGLMVIVP